MPQVLQAVAQSLVHLFFAVGQNNFGNKIPLMLCSYRKQNEKEEKKWQYITKCKSIMSVLT